VINGQAHALTLWRRRGSYFLTRSFRCRRVGELGGTTFFFLLPFRLLFPFPLPRPFSSNSHSYLPTPVPRSQAHSCSCAPFQTHTQHTLYICLNSSRRPLDLQRLVLLAMAGQVRNEVPPGIDKAREAIIGLVEHIRQELGLSYSKIIIGGFSQVCSLSLSLFVSCCLYLPLFCSSLNSDREQC
jgi:hypothetical protein